MIVMMEEGAREVRIGAGLLYFFQSDCSAAAAVQLSRGARATHCPRACMHARDALAIPHTHTVLLRGGGGIYALTMVHGPCAGRGRGGARAQWRGEQHSNLLVLASIEDLGCGLFKELPLFSPFILFYSFESFEASAIEAGCPAVC